MPKNSLIACLAVMLFAAATAGHAQSIGYVGTLGGELSSAVSYNSAGGGNSVSIVGTGEYQVTLGGLGDSLNSNIQVNAADYDGTVHYCTIGDWGSFNDVDVTAYVFCFDSSVSRMAVNLWNQMDGSIFPDNFMVPCAVAMACCYNSGNSGKSWM